MTESGKKKISKGKNFKAKISVVVAARRLMCNHRQERERIFHESACNFELLSLYLIEAQFL